MAVRTETQKTVFFALLALNYNLAEGNPHVYGENVENAVKIVEQMLNSLLSEGELFLLVS